MRGGDSPRGALGASGLDLVRAFDIARYNDAVAGHPTLAPLPTLGRARTLGLLIGNTAVLWPRFLDAYRASPRLRDADDPLDEYVERAVREGAERLGVRTEVRFAHARGADLVCMLRLAEAAGLARIGPAHLAVHPEHGPWFALRAVIVADSDPPLDPPAVSDPCAGCAAPCRVALEEAISRAGRPEGAAAVAASWRDWVAVRDACPVGRASRYGEAQIRYHYTRDRAVIEAAARG